MRIAAAFIVVAAAGLPAAQAQSNCIGTDAHKTCTDASGNTYTVTKFGNTTNVYGSSSRTGNTWNQQSTTFGNTTITNGQSADGNSWNMTQNRFANSTITYGTDSSGNTFNYLTTDNTTSGSSLLTKPKE